MRPATDRARRRGGSCGASAEVHGPARGGTPRAGLLRIEGDRSADERLERVRVDRFAFMDVDRAPDVPVEARIEELGGVLQRSSLEERQLDGALVGLAGADAAVMGPDRNAGVRGLHPLPLF